jgi:hypothetical protein
MAPVEAKQVAEVREEARGFTHISSPSSQSSPEKQAPSAPLCWEALEGQGPLVRMVVHAASTQSTWC